MDDADQIAHRIHQRWGPVARAAALANEPDPADAEALLRRIVRENHPEFDMTVPGPVVTAAELRGRTNARNGEAGFVSSVGDDVIVTVTSIQRSNGAAWKGERGKVIDKTGDGCKVRFGDLILDNIKDSEITPA